MATPVQPGKAPPGSRRLRRPNKDALLLQRAARRRSPRARRVLPGRSNPPQRDQRRPT